MTMTMLLALLVFPGIAMLWLLLCDRLGLVRDEPLIEDQAQPQAGRGRPQNGAGPPVVPAKPRTNLS